ncbi:IclR family transcriptional regulator [Paenarthrobacter sp. NPDC090520]|uniref:IclR family transcriptional regulator n=1 Tax=Paenarthrobacter sp. NPDC090520 TaxID=3364382 RepID=UPI00381A9AEF
MKSDKFSLGCAQWRGTSVRRHYAWAWRSAPKSQSDARCNTPPLTSGYPSEAVEADGDWTVNFGRGSILLMPRTQSGESVLSRAVRIVESFAAGDTGLTVTEIAKRSGLHIATASRLVEELCGLGWLQRDAKRRVMIGVRMWEVVSRASPTQGLREAAMPMMEDLHGIIGQHIQLGVMEGDDVLFVERLTAPGAVVNFTRVAGRLPLHASSAGLLLLAYAPTEQQEQILSKPLEVYTAQTISTAFQLRRALADVRQQGFAFLAGHIHPDATGIAVPVRNPTGRVVAALAAIVPNDDSARSRIAVLQAAAAAVSRSMAYPTAPHLTDF